MQELQRLPIGDASRQRRLAAIDRAVQQYLPDVAREELREAGVQTATSAATKRAKVDAQIDATKKTEPKGSTGPAAAGGSPLSASAAFDHAPSGVAKGQSRQDLRQRREGTDSASRASVDVVSVKLPVNRPGSY